MLERKLGSVQTILDIQPIPDADAIEVATVLGWKVVIRKAENHYVGEKVVYIEVDSVLPKKDEYAFLANYNYRVKTQKFRGQVSQGLILPFSVLPDGEYTDGDDVTDILGITKYERPLPLSVGGDIAGPFPGFLEKTDEMRVQVLGDILPKYNGVHFYATEKVDGTSLTVYNHQGHIGVCTRNNEMKDTENSAPWKLMHSLGVIEKMENMPEIAIQGEMIGWNIQGNKYRLKTNEYRFYMFNAFDIKTFAPLPMKDFLRIAKELGVNTVPMVDEDYVLDFDVDTLVEMAKGNSQIMPSIKREGLVFKSVDYVVDRELGRLSFKAINPDFLIKYKDD